MKNLFYRLLIYLDTAGESDTYYNIALYIVNHIECIARMRINELAGACYVSPATISRFCKALGYENFAHLKQECYTFQDVDYDTTNFINIPMDVMYARPKDAAGDYINRVCDSLHAMNDAMDWPAVDTLLHAIHQSDRVAFFGLQFSQSAAVYFQTDLLLSGKYTLAYLDSERQIECAKSLDENSLAIIMTVNGNIRKGGSKLLRYVRRSNAKIAVISCLDKNAFDFPIDYMVSLGHPGDPKVGKHNLLTLVELMSFRYYTLFAAAEGRVIR